MRKRLELEAREAELRRSEPQVITPGAPPKTPPELVIPESFEEVKQRSA